MYGVWTSTKDRYLFNNRLFPFQSFEKEYSYTLTFILKQGKLTYITILVEFYRTFQKSVCKICQNTSFLWSVSFCIRETGKKTLREKCPYSEFFWSVFFHIRIKYRDLLIHSEWKLVFQHILSSEIPYFIDILLTVTSFLWLLNNQFLF